MHRLMGTPSKLAILLTVLAVLSAACAESDGAEATTTVSVETTPDEPAPATPSDSEDATEFATVSLPDGLRHWWESSSRAQSFGGSSFLLVASSDVAIRGQDPGITVLRLDGSLEWTDVDIAIPPSTSSADIHMTGSQLVISYLDEAGEIVVESSTDGMTFVETRLPLPERYVEANRWAHTSLIGNLAGAADLSESVFAIARAGITWARPTDIAQEYAMEQDPAAAESIRFANTIRTSPTDDGDAVFEFVKSDEVVAVVLGSDAGIEPGYAVAYRDREDDTFERQSWTIDGATSTNLDTSPFNGEQGFQIHALYPVEGGVGAMVTDLSFAERAEEASMQQDSFGYRGVATPGAAAIRTGESEWRLRTLITLDGLAWLFATALGIPNPRFGSLAWATYEGVPLFILAFFADGEAKMAASPDGGTWSEADYIIDIDGGQPGSVQVQVTGESTTHLYFSGDGSYSEYTVTYGPSGDAIIAPKVESVIPELAPSGVAVRTTPTSEEVAAFEQEREEARSVGTLLGDALFPRRPTGN